MKFADDPTVPSWVVTTRFEQERDAYAHLVHGGVCDKGIVPKCFGWLTLTHEIIDKFGTLPSQVDTARIMRNSETTPRGILLEYFPDAQPFSIQNVTYELAEQAARALYFVHAAYVMHGDINRRNVLLLSGGRVVWVDFNFSMCASDSRLTREDLFTEFKEGWDAFYMRLVSTIVCALLLIVTSYSMVSYT